MERKQLFWVCVFIALLPIFTAAAETRVGDFLEAALRGRETGSVADVSANFSAAAEATTKPNQKSVVYLLHSDYLLNMREWEKVISLQQQILREGTPGDRPNALYNLIWGHLELKQTEKATSACAEFQASSSKETQLETIEYMRHVFPGSIHARIADLLATTPSAQEPLKQAMIPAATGDAQSSPTDVPMFLDESQSSKRPSPSVLSQLQAPSPQRPPTPPPEETVPAREEPSKALTVRLAGWQSTVDGSIDSSGMALDLGSHISVDRIITPSLSILADLSSKDRISLSYAEFRFKGTLTRTTVHQRKTYSPGASFRFNTMLLELAGYHELRSCPTRNWGLVYGVTLVDSDLKVTQQGPTGRQEANWDSRFAYPYLGLSGTSSLGNDLALDGSIKWFSWSGNGRFKTHDLELKLVFGDRKRRSARNGNLIGFVGYRDFCWSGDFDNDSAEILFSGPIFGIEATF